MLNRRTAFSRDKSSDRAYNGPAAFGQQASVSRRSFSLKAMAVMRPIPAVRGNGAPSDKLPFAERAEPHGAALAGPFAALIAAMIAFS